MKKWSALLLLAALALLLAGCVQDWAGRATPAGPTGSAPTLTPAQPTAVPPSATSTSEPLAPTPEPPTPTPAPPTPTSPPTRAPTAAPSASRIQFPSGGTTAMLNGSLAALGRDVYVLRATAGQVLDVEVDWTGDQALLEIWASDGSVLKHAAVGSPFWRDYLPSTQDYFVSVNAEGGAVDYTLRVSVPERISFAPGATTARVDGLLTPSAPDLLVLKASAGQTMEVAFDSPSLGTALGIWGFDGTVLKAPVGSGRSWIGTLPSTQDYIIYLYNWSEVASYRLEIGIPAGGEPQPVRITFPVGGTTAAESGSLAVLGMEVYVLRASAGQILDVQADWSGGQVLLEIWGADGTVLKHAAAGDTLWRDYLPSTQDYFVKVIAEGGAADYTLRVSAPARISFAVGAVSATVTGRVESRGSTLYVLRAGAGQEMEVELDAADPTILPSIWGFDGSVLKRYVDGAQSWSGDLASTQDYFILVSSYGGAGAFSLTVTVR